jgi:hypothetical protein
MFFDFVAPLMDNRQRAHNEIARLGSFQNQRLQPFIPNMNIKSFFYKKVMDWRLTFLTSWVGVSIEINAIIITVLPKPISSVNKD